MKLQKFFQYAYLFFAVLFIYEAIANWDVDRNKAYILLGVAVLAVFMFFFRMRFAKKMQDRNQK